MSTIRKTELYRNIIPLKHLDILEYKPNLSSRIYTSDGLLLKSFFIEERIYVPINRIPNNVIEYFNQRINQLNKQKINLEHDNIIELTEKQELDLKVTEIFQKIDMLNIYAGGISIKV